MGTGLQTLGTETSAFFFWFERPSGSFVRHLHTEYLNRGSVWGGGQDF